MSTYKVKIRDVTRCPGSNRTLSSVPTYGVPIMIKAFRNTRGHTHGYYMQIENNEGAGRMVPYKEPTDAVQ